ncbi:MAG: serine/threonine-protein kinase [Candidatus Obscuribacterales bacterium]|nr:serine/threonine-protein kinase [Candidatus Obscuribacterales bacterium]
MNDSDSPDLHKDTPRAAAQAHTDAPQNAPEEPAENSKDEAKVISPPKSSQANLSAATPVSSFSRPKSPDSQFPNNNALTPRNSFNNLPEAQSNRLTPSTSKPSISASQTATNAPAPPPTVTPAPSHHTPTSKNYPTPLPPPTEGEIGQPCPTCGLSFNQAIVICPNDGTSLRKHVSAKISLVKRFEFLSEAGVGGVGTIYKAKQRNNENIVAIKMLSFDDVSSEAKKRFQEEAKACSRMEHPNLPKLLDYGLTEHGQPYMVLEYFDGSDLSDVLKKAGGVSLTTALDIAEQICLGLQYAHGQGVLHRDLKPSNIMIKWTDGSPLVKIVDFGIAKLIDDEDHKDKLTKTGEVIGTPTYMSPEQILGKEIDQRSDLYSVGCVLYELLAGVPPFVGENSVQTILKQLNDKPQSMSEASKGRIFPVDLESTIAKLLQKDPKDRYRNAGALQEDIHNVRANFNQLQTAPVTEKPKVNAPSAAEKLMHKIEHQFDKLPDQRELAALFIVFLTAVAIIVYGLVMQNKTTKAELLKENLDPSVLHKAEAKLPHKNKHEHKVNQVP